MLASISYLFLCLLVFIMLWAAKPLFAHRVSKHIDAAQIRTLLNPPDPLGSLLLARAKPNQRLVAAFGLTSTFVSGDPKIHRTFITRAKALIAGAGDRDDRWRMVAQSAEATSQRFLAPVQRPVGFATMVQCITLAVVLATLFDTDLDAVCYDDLVYVTETINQRWKDSKTKNPATMRAESDGLQRLQEHLDRWIIDRERYPHPLNFILPAYETMWRVVAVAVAYVYRSRDNALNDVVRAFARDPTEARFGTFEGEGPSMEAIVLEVLRLHPPTRHIARAPVGRGWWDALVGVAAVELADVETVHMSAAYGENAREFDPMRFRASPSVRAEMFSFGYGRLKCVAAGWAPMAAGVIAAKVVAQMEEGGCTVSVGDKIGGRSGWDGWAVERK